MKIRELIKELERYEEDIEVRLLRHFETEKHLFDFNIYEIQEQDLKNYKLVNLDNAKEYKKVLYIIQSY